MISTLIENDKTVRKKDKSIAGSGTARSSLEFCIPLFLKCRGQVLYFA
jgi:hypothetical protein